METDSSTPMRKRDKSFVAYGLELSRATSIARFQSFARIDYRAHGSWRTTHEHPTQGFRVTLFANRAGLAAVDGKREDPNQLR